MGIRAKSFATTFSGACMPHWRCRATDLLVVRLDNEKRKLLKTRLSRKLAQELQLISWLDSSIELFYQFEKCYRGRTWWERKLINFMYTQYCKPAAVVFPFKQRPVIRELESYPLSVSYLHASIKHSFFLPACWAFLRTNNWLHHRARLTKAWLKRSGSSTCLTKSHVWPRAIMALNLVPRGPFCDPRHWPKGSRPLGTRLALGMTYYAHAYKRCSGFQAPLLPLKEKVLWPQMRDGECSLGLLSLTMKNKTCAVQSRAIQPTGQIRI